VIETITASKMTDRSVVATCLLGSHSSTGLSGVALTSERLGNERPTKASAVAAVAQAKVYAAVIAAADAADGRQKTQHHSMWAFRGPDPWRDPA
jgi:delta-aminolevulinic acid dehydratase/porphobilinogen synthase